MPDPFQNLQAADPDFVAQIAKTLESRAAEPDMVAITQSYLSGLPWTDIALAVDVGCGTGPIARAMAAHANAAGQGARTLGIEPSQELIAVAKKLGDGIQNLSFEVADGLTLPLDDGAADLLVYHTVLTHVTEPPKLLAEARRVLRPGGTIVICDADFSKASLSGGADDPLGVFAGAFVRHQVTDAYLVARLPALVRNAGFDQTRFDIANRIVRDGDGMSVYIAINRARMVAEGLIGQPLADALLDEYARRRDTGTLYGFIPFATLIARRGP